jgi:hypothetical protein
MPRRLDEGARHFGDAGVSSSPRFVLRFFFDAGSGICLWAANDAARERWDYPVSTDDLPLGEETRAELETLIARYDSCVDWNDPGRGSVWTAAEEADFATQAQALLARVRRELGDDIAIVDECGGAATG